MLATVYTDDRERSRAFSWALSGLAMGVLGEFRVQLCHGYYPVNAQDRLLRREVFMKMDFCDEKVELSFSRFF